MVVWSDIAKADIQHIFDFIAHDPKQYARKVVAEIVAKTDILEELPKIGKVVPEINQDAVRELHIYSYRILYEITSPNIVVLAVLHQRRNFDVNNLR